MRIAVCHPHAPFMRGGAETHTEALAVALRGAGHDVETVTVPFKWYPPSELVHQMGTWRSLDLTESNGIPIDLVVALKFPAYLVRHPNKVVWLMHQHRPAWDLWDHPAGDLRSQPGGVLVRDMIRRADRLALGEARKLFTNSENVRRRLESSVGLPGEVLYHRSPIATRLLQSDPGPPGDYVLFPSRFDPLKRHELAIRAMQHVLSDVRLVLVGAGAEEAAIRRRIDELHVASRVEVRVGLPEDELIELYLGALGVYYGPWDEDYGLVTVEAMAAARPVVTTNDSGGPLELVEDGVTGIVAPPDPLSIADALDRLFKDPPLAERMGAAGRAAASERIPDWPEIARRILA